MTIKKRMSLLFFLDSAIVLCSIYIGYFFLHPYVDLWSNEVLFISALVIFIAHHFFAWTFGLYRKSWTYASIGEILSILKAVTMTIATVAAVQYLVNQDIYIRALALTWMLHILLISGSRLSWRLFRNALSNKLEVQTDRTLVIGAGAAGTLVARQLLHNPESGMKPVLFVDDDRTKQGLEIYGIKVVGRTATIPEIVRDNLIEKIIIAIPSLTKTEMANLTRICVGTGVKTQTIPRIEDLMTGKITVNDIRDVRIEDLLGREEVRLDLKKIRDKLHGKTILITGAGGSIGSEISRQVSTFSPERVILLGHGENSIYQIEREMRRDFSEYVEFIPVIADVQDRNRIFEVVERFKPDVIYHAAAHKHVPLMEVNPIEAVKNNIFGTKNVAEAADYYGVGHFVLISTDKAVNPPNVMGATKRIAEMVIQNLSVESKTKFAAVRFGNVLGSRGSVVPLFKEQIKQGGPVTVTDPRMTRYFMTIPEASRLVIQAGAFASGGEVFVLDMGEPVKIVDLAKNLIKLSGFNEDEIEINFSGIRPGEKLYEELLSDDEIQTRFVLPKIHIGKATPVNKYELENVLENVKTLDCDELKKKLISLANRKTSQATKKLKLASS